MMRKQKNIPIKFAIFTSVISFLLFSFFSPKKEIETTNTIKIKQIKDRVVTNKTQEITIETYESKSLKNNYLILSGTYGTTVLNPSVKNKKLVFVIPTTFTKHAGVVTYHLFHNDSVLQKGTFNIITNTKELGIIENYLGPRSIVANDRDYTMLVSIPTDSLDNLLPNNTQIELNTQFKNNITNDKQLLKDGFAWKRISAPLKTGRLSTGSTLQNIASKELVADVFPDIAQNFIISENSNNDYADGNEIISFNTSQIKDVNGNIMTDGTLITFIITNDDGAFWQTKASTINGFATAKMLHPQKPANWKIIAYISGIANSIEITKSFKPIIDTIPIRRIQNRDIVIGPLTSFLGQLVQDGINVSLEIEKTKLEALTKNGEVNFHLNKENFKKGEHTVNIETLGFKSSLKIRLD